MTANNSSALITAEGPPSYFPDFEDVYSQFRAGYALETCKKHAEVLSKGIELFAPAGDVESNAARPKYDLKGSPADFKNDSGDHKSACKSLSRSLGLHASQCLLLLQRWLPRGNTTVTTSWSPTPDEIESMRQYYISQRWHLLLCQQAAIDVGSMSKESVLPANKMMLNAFSSACSLINAMHSTDFLTNGRSDQMPVWVQGATRMRDQLECELCLMLENALHLLANHTPALKDIMQLASCMGGALSQLPHCVLSEHASLLSLAARCTTVLVLASMQCRQVLASPDLSDVANSIDVEQLTSFAQSLLRGASNRLLAPWMLTCASQITLAHTSDSVSGATEELCQKLVHTAETSSPIQVLHQLFAHQSICEPERQQRYAEVIFFVLGSWCKAFQLKISTLPYETVQDMLSLLGDLFHENPDLTREFWSGSNAMHFMYALLNDSATLFPVFPNPFTSMLSGLCTSGNTGVWHALDNLQTFTAYLNEENLGAVTVRGSTVSIADPVDNVLKAVVLQVAPIYGEGVLINMPVLAERLIVGEGVLVQWSLQQTSNTGLGLTLLVEEVLDRSDKLRQFCLTQENLDVVHNVAATLQSCTKLLAKYASQLHRMLDLNPWRMLDLLHRKVAGSRLAGRALCTALHSTLSVIGSSVSLLPASLFQITDIWTLLAESAGSCLSALGSIAVVLPAAVMQLVLREQQDGMPHDRGCWLLSVLEGVHELERRIGKYPASLAGIQLLTSLCAAVGLSDALVTLTVRLLSSIGCYHSQWNFAPTADCWELSKAVIKLLRLALQAGCVASVNSVAKSLRSSLLYSIIQDGLLTRLFWANLPPAQKLVPASALFSALPSKHATAVCECMELVPDMVEVAVQAEELIGGLCATLFMSELSGPSVAGILCSYCADASDDPAVPLKCVASLIRLLAAAKQQGSHDFVPTLLAARVVPGSDSSQEPESSLRQILVQPLGMQNCICFPEVAKWAADSIAVCFEDLSHQLILPSHPVLGHILVVPCKLKQFRAASASEKPPSSEVAVVKNPAFSAVRCKEEKVIDMPSLVDVLWESLQEASDQQFLAGPHLLQAAPIFQSLLTVVQSRHPCRIVLLSQPQFWSSVHSVWAAAIDKMEVSGADGHVELVTHIIDLVTCVVFDVWNGKTSDLQTFGASAELDSEAPWATLPDLSGSVSLSSTSAMQGDLKKLLSDIFSADGILPTWFLHQAQSNSALEASDKAEALLIEVAEAAALLLWCVMDKQVPADLSQDVLELWQELHALFSEVPDLITSSAATDSATETSHTKRLQQGLLHALLGQDQPEDMSRGDLIRLQELAQLLRGTHCHVCILDRISVSSSRDNDSGSGRSVDPHRWLSLAGLVLRGAAVKEYQEPVMNIFGQFCGALEAMASCQGVSSLLRAYCRLSHVAMMHPEGSGIVSKLLDQKHQCLLLEAAQEAWQDALRVCVCSEESTTPQRTKAAKRRTSWRPAADSAWQRCMTCLSLAHSFTTLSNMAVASRGGRMTSSGPRLRREPSFAQLAGPDHTSSSSQGEVSASTKCACLVLELCKQALSQVGVLEARMQHLRGQRGDADGHPPVGRHELVTSVLEAALNAVAMNQNTLAGVILPATGPTDRKGAAPQLYLDALQALTASATNTSEADHSLAMSVLLGMVTLVCQHAATNSAVSLSQVLSLVPPLHIMRAVRSSVPPVSSVGALHEHLAGAQFCAAALCLLQQLAECTCMRGGAAHEDIFSELLHLHKSLSTDILGGKVPDVDTPGQLLSGAMVSSASGGPQQNATSPFPLAGTSKSQIQAGQKRSHTDRSSGQGLLQSSIANGGQKRVPGHSRSGQRLCQEVMQTQILRVLSVFLSIPKPPTSSIVAVITTQHARLQQLLRTFNAFLFEEESEDTAVLTMALLEEMHTHLDMWLILTAYRGQIILTAPSAIPALRKQLCKLLKTVAYVPTDQSAIARLSTKPTDAVEVKLAEEPTTKASEPLLGLHHFWFWITAVCASGVSTEGSITMPLWARKSGSRTPHGGSVHPTSSPEPRRRSRFSRSFSPGQMTKTHESLSPPPFTTHATVRHSSRSPSASPITALVPHGSVKSPSAGLPVPSHGEDVESTRYSERLAVGVYRLARVSVRLLAALDPTQQANEVESLDPDCVLDMNTAIDLQRQCFELSKIMNCRQGDRCIDEEARRHMQEDLAHALIDLLEYTSNQINVYSLRHETSGKLHALQGAGHFRNVSNVLQTLTRLVS